MNDVETDLRVARHRQGGRRRGGARRARLQHQPGAHGRLLRRARGRDRRERRRRRAQPQGSRRAADAGARAHARARAARRRPGAAARDALALHRDDGAARLPGGGAARRLVRVHGRATARERQLAALGRADAREPPRRGLQRRARRGRAGRDVRVLHGARRPHRAARREPGRVRRVDLPAPAARRHDLDAAAATARGRAGGSAGTRCWQRSRACARSSAGRSWSRRSRSSSACRRSST